MATYDVTAPDGTPYEIEAENDAKAQEAMAHLQSIHKSSPEFDNMAAGKSVTDNAQAIEPGVYDDTEPAEQKILNNVNALGAGASLPSAALSVAKLVGLGEGAGTVAQYAGRFGEKQAIQSLGRVPMGMDSEAARALGRKANDYGLLDTTVGPIGRKEAIETMGGQAGKDLGMIRDAASEGGPAMTGEEMANAIRERLKEAYSEGGENYDQIDELERQLANVKNMPSTTPADFAERATQINTKARGKGLMLPKNVDTDISGAMSHINDETIASKVPGMAEDYAAKREMFGDMNDLGNIVERGEKRALNQRGGNTLFEQGKKFTEELGSHKLGAKVGFGLESAMQGVGDVVTNANKNMTDVTNQLIQRLSTNPQSFGPYAQPLLQAAQQGGSQGLAATHFILANQYPEYNSMVKAQPEEDKAPE